MNRKIVTVKNPLLRQKSRPVSKIDKKTHELIADMRDTLAAQSDPEGVGLAAPQIGKNVRVFLMVHEGVERICINPEVIEVSEPKKKPKKKAKTVLEGCLSLPHYYGPLTRAKKITISYLSETGQKVTETFEGFLAQIVQHEIDHLDGVLFIDRIVEQHAPLYLFHGEEWEEVELV
jgi:peptide deformylase